MLFVAQLLVLLAATVLLSLALPGRPTRPEGLVGLHVLTIPLSLANTLALSLALLTQPTQVVPAWELGVALPGHLMTLFAVPYGCFAARRATFAKLLTTLAVASSVAVVHTMALPPTIALLGEYGVLTSGVGCYAVLAVGWARARVRRIAARRARRDAPDSFERRQGAWQREQWLQLPADARVAELLPFARSLDATTKVECLARLAQLPAAELERDLIARADADVSDAWFYLVHHFPRSRAALAPALHDVLERRLAAWQTAARSADATSVRSVDVVPCLEAAVAVQKEGGDLVPVLRRWQAALAASPPYADIARQLGRLLRRL